MSETNSCQMEKVIISLHLKQNNTNLDDVPMDDILGDLKPTGIEMGASNIKWFHTLGKNSKYILYNMQRTSEDKFTCEQTL